MKLHYFECEACRRNIMKDFVKYDKVSQYLQALVNDCVAGVDPGFEMFPLDCAYKDAVTGETRWIIQSGQVHKDAQKNINKLKRLPVRFDRFISDKLCISADEFERECFFSWE